MFAWLNNHLAPFIGLRVISFDIVTVHGAVIATDSIQLVTENAHANGVTRRIYRCNNSPRIGLRVVSATMTAQMVKLCTDAVQNFRLLTAFDYPALKMPLKKNSVLIL